MNSTNAIFSDTHFDFSPSSNGELQDLIDELESFLALERRIPSRQERLRSANRDNESSIRYL
jgi:hypothetical protein